MIRLRHPQGVATLPIQDSTTLADLQAAILSSTEVPISEQEILVGFPPKAIDTDAAAPTTLLSDLTISIKKGDQIILARRAGAATSASAPARSPATAPVRSPPPISSSSGPSLTGKSSRGDISYALRDANGEEQHLVLRIVPDDNSCLFNAVGCVVKRVSDEATCNELRQVVAKAIRSDPEEYNEAVLGSTPETYSAQILRPTTWGGGIELRILSDHFDVQINSIDIATGRIDRYGEDSASAEEVVFVAYSGIHYDAITLQSDPDDPLEFATTSFTRSAAAERIEPTLKKLAEELKNAKYYTDTATFTLLCKQCGAKLVGEKGVAQHGMQTGHSDFEEYSAA